MQCREDFPKLKCTQNAPTHPSMQYKTVLQENAVLTVLTVQWIAWQSKAQQGEDALGAIHLLRDTVHHCYPTYRRNLLQQSFHLAGVLGRDILGGHCIHCVNWRDNKFSNLLWQIFYFSTPSPPSPPSQSSSTNPTKKELFPMKISHLQIGHPSHRGDVGRPKITRTPSNTAVSTPSTSPSTSSTSISTSTSCSR